MLTTRRHSRRTAGTALVVAALMLLLAAPAGAQGPPQTGSGEAIVTFIDPPPPEPGDRVDLGNSGNWRQTRTLTGDIIDGPLGGGSFEQTVTGVVRTDANFVTYHGTMTVESPAEDPFKDLCDGVDTITLGVTGRGQAAPPVTEASVHVIDSSPGDVTGRGTVTQVGESLTYDIQYICR